MEREALKLALEALEEARTNDDSCAKWDRNKEAITAIKETLAQPTQEPANYLHAVLNAFGPDEGISLDQKGWSQLHAAIKAALAQPVQEPVECLDCGSHNVGIPATYDSLVDSVKAQPAQEPVARVSGTYGGKFVYDPINRATILPIGMALYAEPLPAQEPVAWLSTDSIGEQYLCFSKPLDNDPVQPLYTAPPLPAQPVQEPVAREWNFCERCGKRTKDMTTIHTCTPPQ